MRNFIICVKGVNVSMVNLLHDLTQAIDKYNLDFDAFAYGQLKSKQWIIDELEAMNNPYLGVVFNLCGWYGLLPAMMFNARIKAKKIRSFDIDESCWMIADQMNKTHIQDEWRFKAIIEDINNINFETHTWEGWSNVAMDYISVTESPDTIINTSCEHTNDEWYKNIPSGKLVILQSNDYWAGDKHINCCFDFDDFSNRYPMKDVLYHGQRAFEKYTRFMKIGRK